MTASRRNDYFKSQCFSSAHLSPIQQVNHRESISICPNLLLIPRKGIESVPYGLFLDEAANCDRNDQFP
jgi:hypothetical protein